MTQDNLITGSTMEEIYDSLATRVLALHSKKAEQHKRLIIAVAGMPGSGKTTLAEQVVELVNKRSSSSSSSSSSSPSPSCSRIAAVVPLDGFHYSRAELDQMADPETAHQRRGAPFTFDAQKAVDTIAKLTSEKEVHFPTFDHRIKDPVEDGLTVDGSVEIVLVEGLYLLLKDEPWCHVSQWVDEKWMVTVESKLALNRVGKRHFAAGITSSLELGLKQAYSNDAQNGELVAAESVTPDLVIQSVEQGN